MRGLAAWGLARSFDLRAAEDRSGYQTAFSTRTCWELWMRDRKGRSGGIYGVL